MLFCGMMTWPSVAVPSLVSAGCTVAPSLQELHPPSHPQFEQPILQPHVEQPLLQPQWQLATGGS
jgi:hypothetical protein